jgi:carbohydrate kinase (thermoresistant glucokinase family)
MGPAGCGKTRIGHGLAAEIGASFIDGDDYHPEANIERIRRGQALTDADRWPWLARLAAMIGTEARAGRSTVLACSALKRCYREALGFPAARRWVVELRAPESVLRARLAERQGHFFNADLLESQLATLEPVTDGLVVAADAPDATIIDRIRRCLGL